jgi:hypothetical protein
MKEIWSRKLPFGLRSVNFLFGTVTRAPLGGHGFYPLNHLLMAMNGLTSHSLKFWVFLPNPKYVILPIVY